MFVWSLFLSLAAVQARSFTDDRGITHEFTGKPTIVTFAHTAVTLSHFGLGLDQLVGVWGEFAIDGSDYDFNSDSESSYPADPTPEEMEFLASVTHISPSCKVGYCTEFDLEIFESVKPDYIVMHGYRGKLYGFNTTIEKQVVNMLGKPIIYIDVTQDATQPGGNCVGDGGDNSTYCFGKSMIQVIEQYEALALALGAPRPASIDQDKREMCKAAKEFQEAAKIAHSKGVRALAAYIVDDPTQLSYVAFLADDMVLRMYEELGMPILHPGSCQAANCSQNYFWEWVPTSEFFPECPPGGPLTPECAANPLYPVDLWLYDHRTTMMFISDEFKTTFPDRAVLQGQHVYWPFGGGMISYRHAAEILSIVAPRLAAAERIHPATPCTPADVSSANHAIEGLGPSQYACYDETFHRMDYFQCPADDNKALKGGGIAGIVIAGVVVAAVTSFFVVQRCASGKESPK
ncbi:hypothetical protein FisN_10Lu386 [Fistulifera solaris]|uniref:Fe/B12 periplasmic-binding domain-containing protein n=1 Tax=Fistulifera solaris TaxID=1519565 RepID=A0A1Z5JUS1_FISSO|nr:hypothetical protein FisN_10Lu386 [Fistulifera solaris]|eukprot:GAX17669.1 hypothetical protein FisN_10Lu386 [Fistulifera solaris]